MSAALECIYNLNLNNYYNIYTTIHEMLDQRGYEPIEPKMDKKIWVSKYLGLIAELENNTITDEFEMIDKMSLLFTRNKKLLLVYFHPFDIKLAQKDMNCVHKLMNEKKAQHLIIVANNKATPKVTNVLGILGHNAQLFTEQELSFNITKHQLVPKHVKVDDEEKKHILEKYAKHPDGNIHIEMLPAIFINDPVAKFYGFKVDDLIRIERPRLDGYFDYTYRVVTNPMSDKDNN
jgi:DNA-directed RNA polymerases I, II, and III subunit RPABC1